ncbi:MAG: ferritin-like domain-containing protein [candidate division NC10 bacterium]|nr:ferritin-like domain-containing protein [candidate division NC10 bacterium]
MDKETLIEGLNRDLAGEYRAILQYLQHSYMLKGLERLTLGELFKKFAIGEMKHAEFLAEKIVALGGVPTVTPLSIVQPTTAREMLQANLAAERQAIADYKERADQAEEYGDEGLEVELEEIMAEETRHAEELEKLLGG